jgi:hypothetical protein
MLLLWPNFLPPDEREEALASVSSQRDVFRDIAERTKTPFGTVNSDFHRGRTARRIIYSKAFFYGFTAAGCFSDNGYHAYGKGWMDPKQQSNEQ